jgi:hypothetical protein
MCFPLTRPRRGFEFVAKGIHSVYTGGESGEGAYAFSIVLPTFLAPNSQ